MGCRPGADERRELSGRGAVEVEHADPVGLPRARQVRQHGSRVAGLHESQPHRQVVEGELHRGLEARCLAQRHGPGVRRGPGWLRRPRCLRQVREGLDAAPLLGGDQREAVPGQRLAVQAGVRGRDLVRVRLVDDEVVVASQQAGERDLGLADGDLQVQVPVAVGEKGQDLGQPSERDALEGRDRQGPRHSVGGRGQLRLRLLQPFHDGLGVADQDPCLRRQSDATPDRLEQRDTHFRLEFAQLLRDRRGAVGEGLRHGSQRAAVCQFVEQPEAMHIKHVDCRLPCD